MKLVRYGAPGQERPGIVDNKGSLRDLSEHIPDISAKALSSTEMSRLASLDIESLPLVEDQNVRLGPPVKAIGKVIVSITDDA